MRAADDERVHVLFASPDRERAPDVTNLVGPQRPRYEPRRRHELTHDVAAHLVELVRQFGPPVDEGRTHQVLLLGPHAAPSDTSTIVPNTPSRDPRSGPPISKPRRSEFRRVLLGATRGAQGADSNRQSE